MRLAVRHGLAVFACALGFCADTFAAPARQPEWAYGWRPELGYFDDGPTCLMYPPDGIQPDGLYLTLNWNARHGVFMWIKWRAEDVVSVRLESGRTGDAWDLALQPPRPDYDGHQAFLEGGDAAGILRNLQLEHPLTAVLGLKGGASLRYQVSATAGRVAVPMFKACMKSVTEEPPKYFFHPGREFLGSYMAHERCQFGQIIELNHIPVFVALNAEPDGGEFVFERALTSRTPHGPVRKRAPPDRIEAPLLFGPGFDLVEEYRYDVTPDQLSALVADLSRGATRKFNLTTPEGDKSTLVFGGRMGKPFAAMFAACRQAKFSTQAPGAP